MKMDEHARAWAHEFVAGLLQGHSLPPEQRNSLHWEILSHLHGAAERRVESRAGSYITLADLQAVVQEMGGSQGIIAAFLQTRVFASPRAGFGKRFGAFLIDAVLAMFVIGFFFGALDWFVMDWFAPRWWDVWDFSPFFQFALFYVYLVVMEIRFGATIGKMAFKLKTVMADGRPLTSQAALIRNVAKAFPPLLIVDTLLYLVAFKADDQRASDRLAETIVIHTGRLAWIPVSTPPPVSATPPSASSSYPTGSDAVPSFQTDETPPKRT